MVTRNHETEAEARFLDCLASVFQSKRIGDRNGYLSDAATANDRFGIA